MKYILSMIVVLVLCLPWVSTLSAQEEHESEEIAQQQRAVAQRLEHERAERERQGIRERVKTMARQAAALRGEFKFHEAAIVEAEIRSLCWNFDPRVIRANDLKCRAADARLSGKILDADMFEREASRIMADLKREYAGDEQTLLPATGDNDSPDESRLPDDIATLVDDIANLRAQVVNLTNEIFRLKGELSNREQQLSQSLERR